MGLVQLYMNKLIENEPWYISARDSDVSYIAIYGEGSSTNWTGKVSREYYNSIMVVEKKDYFLKVNHF